MYGCPRLLMAWEGVVVKGKKLHRRYKGGNLTVRRWAAMLRCQQAGWVVWTGISGRKRVLT